jgi:hypothetical protein
MTKLNTDKIIVRGLVWGMVGALVGSLVFSLIASPLVLWEFSQTPLPYSKPIPASPADLIDGYLQRGLGGILQGIKDLLTSAMLAGAVGFICSAVPGALGGMVLALLIHFGVAHDRPFLGRMGVSIAVGAFIGGGIGFLLVVPLSLLPAPDNAILIMGRLVPVVALACGAWVGWRLAGGYQPAKSLRRNDQDFISPSSISEELPILKPLLRGFGWGLIVCVVFNLVFSAIGILLLGMELYHGIFNFIFSIIPAIVGGIVFSIFLYFIPRIPLPTSIRIYIVSIIGGVLGFLIAEPIVIGFIAFNLPQSEIFRQSQVILAFLTAVVIRIWVGKRLTSD